MKESQVKCWMSMKLATSLIDFHFGFLCHRYECPYLRPYANTTTSPALPCCLCLLTGWCPCWAGGDAARQQQSVPGWTICWEACGTLWQCQEKDSALKIQGQWNCAHFLWQNCHPLSPVSPISRKVSLRTRCFLSATLVGLPGQFAVPTGPNPATVHPLCQA